MSMYFIYSKCYIVYCFYNNYVITAGTFVGKYKEVGRFDVGL